MPAAIPALLIFAAAVYLLFIARTAFIVGGVVHFTLIDDAMISMRYAQHLADGYGLVWNIGEAPVQGFSNPGWVLVMSLPHLLPISPAEISLAMIVACAAILLGSTVVAARISMELAPASDVAPLMAAGVTALYYPLVFWSLRGMEVGLLVLLVGLAALEALKLRRDSSRSLIPISLCLAAALIVRLDAALQAALILLYVGAAANVPRARRALLVAVVGITLAGVLALQMAYFGDWLPNTYYQKLVGGTLVERLRAGLLAFYQFAARDVLIMAIVAAAGIWRYRHLRTRETALLMGLFAVQCMYSVWVGGDYAEPELAAANRFITQGMPALIVLFSLVVDHIITGRAAARQGRGGPLRARAWPIAAVAALATVTVISGQPWMSWATENAPLLKADIRRVRAGLAIAASTSKDAVIAVHAAGQIPYYSERRSIDLLGLNDPVVARGPRRAAFYPGHDKWNYEYSIGELQPDLIADNWIRLHDFIVQRNEYRQLENGMYVRADTTRVDESALLSEYP